MNHERISNIHIYATPRSGSNYLHYLLVDHINAEWYGSPFLVEEEVLDKDQDSRVTGIMEDMIRKKSIVWKTHPAWFNHELYNDLIAKKQEFHQFADYTIGLLRKNLFEATLSMYIAKLHDSWIKPYDGDSFEVNLQLFPLYCEHMFGHYLAFVNETIIKCDQILFYEDLGNDPRETLSKLNFIKSTDIRSSYIKQARDKKQIVTNYDDAYICANITFDNLSCDKIEIKDSIITRIDTSGLEKNNGN